MGTTGSILVETFFGFVALFVITKVIGKTQISQLTAFDFISALIFGELVGNAIFDDKAGIKEIAFAVFLWGALLYVTEFLTQRFKRTRSIFEGKPNMIIHKGKLQREEMRKSKLDMNQLLHLLRAKDAFSVKEVDYAILETDGSLSVLKKSLNQSPTRHDMNLMEQKVALPFMLINDGEIIEDSLKEVGKDNTWLTNELQKQNINSYKDVFYAEYKKGEALYVQTF
ncbi:DUF421 domain-containing protein [Aquibacillus koreensis]|uniref:DUF421 domain-containing protein n=1 Tax=Aquibacillus koreensis TaxID=279446 RepID=A0A9X4AJ75_9BACI|nr:DUF421 domain-containing protein [Aquibacillus koreensis]MCT2535677.1 DUF421 domain-containing protein [Aquibacillus koreensis]MDC3420038.1 DUF421 domain-containing protein [Aquibacillus koreensis]